MAYFNEFPHTRTYDSDLGWLIRRIQEVAQIVDEYVSLNSIQFADPINWNITTQYPRLTIVLDSTGGAYISRQPVPAGVPLTNTDYWTEIYNTQAVVDSIRENIAYNNGDLNTAQQAIAEGALFWFAGDLYYATAALAAGTQFVVGTNCRRMTVDEKINLVKGVLETAIAAEAETRIAQIQAEADARIADVLRLDGRIDDTDRRLIEASEKLNNLYLRNVLDYGAIGDGTTDDTTAIQSALEEGVHIYFPPEHVFKFSEILVEVPDVTFSGGGELNGIIRIKAPDPNNTPINTFITGLIFTGETPIVVDRGVSIRIFNNRFFNVKRAVTISPTGAYDPTSYSHLVEDLNIVDNYCYMCDYFVYSDLGTITGVPQDYLYMGDMSIINNQVKVAKITHVYVSHCDGVVISNNVFYHFGSSSRVASKMRCIEFYAYVAGALIEGNRLFESGREAIKLFNANSFTIQGNHIVQPGQCALTSAILIDSYVASGYYGIISGNNIYAPSKFGIELQNAQRVHVVNNYIYNPTTDYGYYGEELGQPPMSSVTHFGVSSVTASGVDYAKITAENFLYNDDIAYTGFVNAKHVEQIKTSGDTINNAGAEIINCNPSSPTTLSALDLSHANHGTVYTLVAYNGNVTVQNNANIRLAGGTDYTMPANSILMLKYMSGILWEIARTET